MALQLETLVATHLEAWNAPSGPKRDQLLAQVYTSDVTVGEPETAYVGQSGVDQAISGIQSAIPGAEITRSSAIQTAQDLSTYSWDLRPTGGPVVATGRDVILVREGRISALYVIIDAPTA